MIYADIVSSAVALFRRDFKSLEFAFHGTPKRVAQSLAVLPYYLSLLAIHETSLSRTPIVVLFACANVRRRRNAACIIGSNHLRLSRRGGRTGDRIPLSGRARFQAGRRAPAHPDQSSAHGRNH